MAVAKKKGRSTALPTRKIIHAIGAALTEASGPPTRHPERRVGNRWTDQLAQSWTPISDVFLEHAHKLPLKTGVAGDTMKVIDMMIIIQLMSYKWDREAPFPAVKTIAKRLGVSDRYVRGRIELMEASGYIKREARVGRSNAYVLDGLFAALEALMEGEGEAPGGTPPARPEPPRQEPPRPPSIFEGIERSKSRPWVVDDDFDDGFSDSEIPF